MTHRDRRTRWFGGQNTGRRDRDVWPNGQRPRHGELPSVTNHDIATSRRHAAALASPARVRPGAPHPFHFGAPQFPVTAVVAMTIVMAVVFAESTASMLALGEITGKSLTRADVARGLVGDGLSAVLAGVLNSFADTVFNQNVGAVATTRVHSRYVTAVSGAILVILGLAPRFGALVAAVPQPVVGGVGLVLFATIAVIGVDTLRKADLTDRVNLTIIAVSIGVGLVPVLTKGMFDKFPSSAQILLNSGISLAAATAFTLNLLFNHTRLGEIARAVKGVQPQALTHSERPSANI
ncbi:purine/pyrimidine permease [Nocardia tengchongensis]|uniref:Purine/pyrimidine permease n=1 Tax=Nocardia tengchongensis TaxID=2055889 RepID=A0ABX8CMG4_9NOCA|nr:purine/pyrimidine permease [Nocardia tengchongensis]